MKKIKLKTLYLIGIITIGLIGLGIGSTYAMFTTSIEIDNPISLSTTLTSESDVIETFDVEVAAGGNKEIPLTINNTSNSKLNYSVWYITSASDIEMGTKLSNSDSSPSSSTIASGETKKVYVQIKNNSTNSIKVTLGVSSSTSNIVLSSSMTMVPNTELAFGKNLLEHITNLYNDNTKTTVTNNSITYNYATSVNLMNDRLGSSTTDINGGNIRYYGSNPNNYIYFNCSDYSNQNAETCELWRIIGVFDGKVKIMRSTPIETLARDHATNASSAGTTSDWTRSSIKVLLNEKYYNGDTTGTVIYYSGTGAPPPSKSLDMSKIGIKNDTTRNMISESTWRIGYGTTGFPNVVYSKEEESYSSYSSTWTGKIALLNTSDYGYAVDLNKCTVNSTYYGNTACASNNWLHSIITSDTWTLDTNSGTSPTLYVFYIPATGVFTTATVNLAKSIYPILNLDIEIIISEKSLGSYRKPYKIIPTGVNLKRDNEDDSYLINHIINLYDNAEKTTITNNNITYNAASSVNLMSDRKGNLSTPLNDGNIRYYGANPNNYIYFNCTDYSNQNADTCELWRIIGVFDGKVKIMRNTPIETLARDHATNASSAGTTSDWTRSSIKVLLNEKYYNGDTTGTVIYYSGTGAPPPSKSLDMSKIGIKNDTTRNMISESTWRIGYGTTGFPNVVYSKEEESYSSYSSTWTGKIALLNTSDYGYAVDLNKCTVNSTYYGNTACASNNWLHSIITSDTWTLDTNSGTSPTLYVFYIPATGVFTTATVNLAKSIYPILYLTTDVMISNKTTGEYRNPYKIISNGTTIVENKNTLEKYIINLYDNAEKTTITNNNIAYNAASSVNLMNDRKGKLSTPLDDGNIRYYGSDPNNYIYFNCTDYSNQNADTCELWRIIGVFDGKVKIMRNTPIETLARDHATNASSAGTTSDWTRSSIKVLLNEKYYNGDTTGTVIYYSGTGAPPPSKSLDMSKIGIKNDTTRNMISESTWRIGYGTTGFPNVVYSKEEESYSSYSSTWTGKIALLNTSDYGYAVDLNKCTVNSTYYGNTACASNNWLHSIITSDTWTLDTNSGTSPTLYVFYIPATGVFTTATVNLAKSIYPTLFLKTLTNIKSGTTGSSDNPFQIEVG